MRIIYFTLISLFFLLAACGGAGETGRNRPADKAATTENAPNTDDGDKSVPAPGGGKVVFNQLGSEAARKLCQEIDTGDTDILKSQTFAINFEPFLDSCFVTTHNPELDDPPLESEIAIYRDNKRVFDFPEQRTGECWVSAVGFRDINGDYLTDIVVMWSCIGKHEPMRENMIYINNSKTFITRPKSNVKLFGLSSIAEIESFAAENSHLFSLMTDAPAKSE